MKISTRGYFLIWPLFGILLLSLLSQRGELLALTLPILFYLLAGVLSSSDWVHLAVEREINRNHTFHGEPVVIGLKVLNAGNHLDEVFLEDLLPAPLQVSEEKNRILTSMDHGETIEWKYTVDTVRGDYRLKNVKATVCDSLGIFQAVTLLEAEKRIVVVPQISKLKQIGIRPRRTRVYSGVIPAAKGGTGTDFFGVREYQKGDSPRLINWKASAHHEVTLFANEFEQERVADVGLIVDCRRRSYELGTPESLLEFTISGAAALTDGLLRDGNRVGMLAYGGFLNWTFPACGKIQRERIFRALTHIRPYRSEVFKRLDKIPTRLFPVKSQLIFISPLQKDDVETLVRLRSHGYHLLVISPDAVSFEQSYKGQHSDAVMGARIKRLERSLTIRRLQGAGIQIVDWDVAIPFHQTIETALHRHRFQMRNLKTG